MDKMPSQTAMHQLKPFTGAAEEEAQHQKHRLGTLSRVRKSRRIRSSSGPNCGFSKHHQKKELPGSGCGWAETGDRRPGSRDQDQSTSAGRKEAKHGGQQEQEEMASVSPVALPAPEGRVERTRNTKMNINLKFSFAQLGLRK